MNVAVPDLHHTQSCIPTVPQAFDELKAMNLLELLEINSSQIESSLHSHVEGIK